MRPQINKKPSHDVLSFRCSSQGSPWSLLSHLPLLTQNKQPALLSQYGRLLLQGLSCSLRLFIVCICLPVVLPKHTAYTYFLNMGPADTLSFICTKVLYRQACLSLCNPRLWDILEMSGMW